MSKFEAAVILFLSWAAEESRLRCDSNYFSPTIDDLSPVKPGRCWRLQLLKQPHVGNHSDQRLTSVLPPTTAAWTDGFIISVGSNHSRRAWNTATATLETNVLSSAAFSRTRFGVLQIGACFYCISTVCGNVQWKVPNWSVCSSRILEIVAVIRDGSCTDPSALVYTHSIPLTHLHTLCSYIKNICAVGLGECYI